MITLGIFIAVVVIGAAALWLAFGWLVAWLLLYSDHHDFPIKQTPADRDLEAHPIKIPVDELKHLSGWLLQPDPQHSLGGACIVMVHGFDSGKDKVWHYPEDDEYRASILEQGAESLWRAGFHIVAIDLRNHGESPNNGPVTLGARESDDVLATLDYLIQHATELGIDPQRIGLRGESMGGATCLIAAARDTENRIAAVWSDSAYADAASAILDFMGYKNIPSLFGPAARFWLTRMANVELDQASPLAFVDRIHCPVFLTHSHGDTMLPVHHLERLTSASDWQHPPESWLVDDHKHNRLWREPGYHDRQVEFFKRWLGESDTFKECA